MRVACMHACWGFRIRARPPLMHHPSPICSCCGRPLPPSAPDVHAHTTADTTARAEPFRRNKECMFFLVEQAWWYYEVRCPCEGVPDSSGFTCDPIQWATVGVYLHGIDRKLQMIDAAR